MAICCSPTLQLMQRIFKNCLSRRFTQKNIRKGCWYGFIDELWELLQQSQNTGHRNLLHYFLCCRSDGKKNQGELGGKGMRLKVPEVYGFKVKVNKNGSITVKEYAYSEEDMIRDAVALVISGNILFTQAHAEGNEIMKAFRPILKLLQDFAEPAAYAGYVLGFVQLMNGNRHKAINTLKYVTLGFVGIHFVPIILETFKGAAQEAAKSVGW